MLMFIIKRDDVPICVWYPAFDITEVYGRTLSAIEFDFFVIARK
jgi:hypothetical protein